MEARCVGRRRRSDIRDDACVLAPSAAAAAVADVLAFAAAAAAALGQTSEQRMVGSLHSWQ